MATFIVRHKVKDYDAWRKVFSEHGNVRAQNGFGESRVYRYAEDPNHVIVVSAVASVDKAREFASSPDLSAKMKEAGVLDEPKMFFLDDGEAFPN